MPAQERSNGELWADAFRIGFTPDGLNKAPVAELLLRYLLWVYVVLRALTVFLAIAVLVALIALIWFTFMPAASIDPPKILAFLATLVTGGAVLFLGRQAAKAKKELDAALAGKGE